MGPLSQESNRSFLPFYRTLDKDDVLAIFEAALVAHTKAARKLREAVEYGYRRIERPGYRRGKVPPKVAAKPLASMCFHEPDVRRVVLPAVLRLWLEIPGLPIDQVRGFVAERGMTPVDPESLEDGFLDNWEPDDFEKAVDQLQEKLPSRRRGELEALLCCVTGCAPLVIEEGSEGTNDTDECENQAKLDVCWETWLAALKDEPADSEHWSGLAAFLKAAAEIGAAKAHEAEGARALSDALTTLREQDQDIIDVFGLPSCGDWAMADFASQELTALVQSLRSLAAKVRDYRGIIDQPEPRRFADRESRFDHLRSLNAEILEAHRELGEIRNQIRAGSSTGTERGDEAVASAEHPEPDRDHNAGTIECLPTSATQADSNLSSNISVEAGAETDTACEPEITSAAAVIASAEMKEIAAPVADACTTSSDPGQFAREREPEPVRLPEVAELVAVPVSAAPVVEAETEETAFEIQTSEASAVVLPDAQTIDPFLWSLVGQGELAPAYWIARGLAARGQAPVTLAEQIEAVFLSEAITDRDSSALTRLRELAAALRHTPDAASSLISLAACSRCALFDGSGSIRDAMMVPGGWPALNSIVQPIRAFARQGLTLSMVDLKSALDHARWEKEIDDCATAAHEWLQAAPLRNIVHYRAATDLLERLAAPNHVLHDMLGPVMNKRLDDAAQLRAKLDGWQDEAVVWREIDRVRRQVQGEHGDPIGGPARNGLIHAFREAEKLARGWCDLALAKPRADKSLWMLERTLELRGHLAAALPAAMEELNTRSLTSGPAVAAAAVCLRRGLAALARLFAIEAEAERVPDPAFREWVRLCETDRTFALRRCILWVPGIELDDAGAPTPADLRNLPTAMERALSARNGPVEAINGWILVEDYRFLTTLLDLLPPGEQARYSKRADAAKRESCARLGTAVADAVIAVEQAVIDGLLAEEDRAIFEAELMSVHAESLSEFGSIKHKIQRIVGEIDQVRSERLQALEGEWEKLQRDFGPPQYPPELCERVRAFFEEQFRLRRTRVVAERLAILTEVVEQHSSLESVVTVPEETVDYLLRFRDMQPQLTEWGLRGLPQLRRSLREDPPGPFSSAIEQMDDVLDAWSGLKRRAAPASGENPGAVQRIAEFLGFSLGVPDANLQPRMGENWLHLTIPASAEMSDVRPFRYFGSDSAGVQRFMCVWDFRDAHEVTDLLVREHLDKSATIVVFLKPLTYDQRGLVPRDCGAGWELPAALVDEHLLLFLCTIEPKSRLRAFLHCAMPFTSVNPYVFSGELPPEMFYGRRDMGTRLQGASGSCIVYGGRQLGKTSLLKQAGRDFQSQGAKRYCFWKRLDSAFPTLGGTPASALWAIIRDGLKQVRLLASNITAAQFEALGAHIENAISTQGAHVLALLDESDNFLAADEHDGFQVVRQVADLMQRTNGRFRVIFAGVHHVQRFQAVPNNPLAHLGEPQLVGPLETAAAQALVVEPLEAVGVRFENQHDASLVLSYTNYHPALIQFLCRSLLEKIMPRRSRQAPPYIVTQADIDAVYRTGKVRDQMRMLFDLTLRLDERYRALVWIMIEQQMDKIGEPLEEFGIAGLLDLARSWWPRGFGEISHEEFQSLLIEMRGLGLLVRTASRLWRLRSPNIAPLFGTEEDVRSNILALEKRPAASRSEASSFHMALDDGGEEYSLLSFGQELRLNQSRFGVGLLFASRATNLEGAAKALERFLPTYAARETMRFERMPLPRPSPGALRRRLEETLQQGTTADRILVVVELPAAEADQLRDMVAEALEFCIRNSARAKKRFLRVFFVFGPESARNWLALPRLEREEIEGRCDGVECAKRWEQVAVMRRLTETQKQDTEDVCRQVYETTGGWGWLIDEVFKAAGRRSDPRIACEQLRKRIESPTFAGELREKLGLQGDCDGWLALQKLVPAKNLPVQELTPDLVECDLTPQRFDAALEFLKRLDCFVAVSSDTIAVDSFLAQHLGVHAAAH